MGVFDRIKRRRTTAIVDRRSKVKQLVGSGAAFACQKRLLLANHREIILCRL
ncbi:hypothetical protein [Thalassospira marina]|uniref:hypothetical protein n=1 Tax=Thalassospira marina TaxID=2048283 RepID=UPI0012FED6A2|nr:hypothetical protein [Thalassospira marina]